jgi:protein-disulfide isomerase
MRRPRVTLAFFTFVVSVAVACGGAGTQQPQALVIPTSSVPVAIASTNDSDLALAIPAGWTDSDAAIPVSSSDPALGARDAYVTLVLFSDFQCPFCARVEPTLAKLREEFGPRDLRVVWKDEPLPFHVNAKPAAEAARGVFELAGNEAFWSFHDKAFEHQADLSRESYVKWAGESGVHDLDAFEDGLESHRWADKVQAGSDEAASVGANGTPHAFVNGIEISGAQDYGKFQTVVEQELQKAKAKVAAGTPRDHVYATMSQLQFKKPAAHGKGDDDSPADTTTVWKVPVDKKQPARGSASALVTIVEFADFQCPFCGRVEPTLEALRKKYGADLRLVWRDEPLPFHPRALPAAELAREARAESGDAGFWTVHDDLLSHQTALDDAGLDAVATRAGLNLAKVHAAIAGGKYKADIDADAALGDDLEANGTPHFFINGRRLVGAQAQDKFEAIIDDEIAKARALVRAGTDATKVYAELTKNGKGPPPPEKKSVPLPARPMARGPASARVTIQEFADFQCPFCARAEDALNEVVKTYGPKVRIVWRDLPLQMHPDAAIAAEAGREAYAQQGSTGFWKLHDLMFANRADLSRATLDGYAQKLSFDMKKWAAALDGATHQSVIDVDTKAAATAGISGTPAFVINGYYLSGAQPFAKFRAIIDRALSEAK